MSLSNHNSPSADSPQDNHNDHNEARKNRPYEFYDTTSSVCSTCLYPVEAKIIFKDNHVYMDKWCPSHGTERVLIMDDVDYYRACREVYVKRPEMPAIFATPMQYGCPYDCGLCPDHMQHSCLSIVEITDVCNLDCPVCFADSGMSREVNLPHLPYKHKSLEMVKAMLDTVVASEGEPDVVQLSGGEPTLHPEFFAILDYAKTLPIRHLMINTNGLRIAKEPEFVARLAEYAYRKDKENPEKIQGIEVYLQFDSLYDEHIKVLRGANLARIHEQALANLEKHSVSTTLVATIKQGLNDHVMGEIIDHALSFRCCRGVSFQPMSEAGRVAVEQKPPFAKGEMGGFDNESPLTPFYERGEEKQTRFNTSPSTTSSHRVTHGNGKKRYTISQMRRQIAEQSSVFTLDDIVPVPCNPDTLAMGYALKSHEDGEGSAPHLTSPPQGGEINHTVVPLTRYITPDVIMNEGGNTILFEQNPEVQAKAQQSLFKVLSTNHSPESQANCLSELLCCLPKIDAPHLSYDNVFRVMIVQFMDAQNLDIRSLKKSCIHFAQPPKATENHKQVKRQPLGTMIPFESYNIFYRDDRQQQLAQIRANLSEGFAKRIVQDNYRGEEMNKDIEVVTVG